MGFAGGRGREPVERIGNAAEEVGLALERGQGKIRFKMKAPSFATQGGEYVARPRTL